MTLPTVTEPTLFDAPVIDRLAPSPVRRSDPSTSHAAAASPSGRRARAAMRTRLLAAYQAATDRGVALTADEAGVRADVPGYSPRRRTSELLAHGWIAVAGQGQSEMGHPMRAFAITDAGRAVLEDGTT